MKKFLLLMVFSICLVFCFLLTASVFGQENIPTVTLPISNFLEVRKDLIRKEGNAFPGGWSEYYIDYKTKTLQRIYGREAEPFYSIEVCPATLETWWVQTLTEQDKNFESDEWAEKDFRKSKPYDLTFQIWLGSDSLNILAKKDLRFVYQDSIGTRKDGKIDLYEVLEETKKPYMVYIELYVRLPSNQQNITWFSLHILNKEFAGRVDMRWDFRKD